ncbi:MAG TPA: hypothetical protein VGH20_08365, partial [Myxococcales bacterium]
DDVKSILMDKDVIAIDQDALGRQGDRVYAEGPVEIWAKPLKDGSKAVAIFNFGEWQTQVKPIGIHLKELGFSGGAKGHDVWANKDLGTIHDDFDAQIARHSVLLLILRK